LFLERNVVVSKLHVYLFGRFDVQVHGQSIEGLDARKVQELFAYLLLYRERPHPREVLADLLWGDSSTSQSKGYLRKTLWQLQSALGGQNDRSQSRVLLVEPDWVQLDPNTDLQLDVAEFEQAFSQVQGVPGSRLESNRIQTLQAAVQLYCGDLLEGWYDDWCLYERERLQHMYLVMLDKLMGYCEVHADYEAGIVYGDAILRYERARERTHRRLMRLQYRAKDRTAALRQYERCVAALDEELGVKPAKNTVALYRQICADQLPAQSSAATNLGAKKETETYPLFKVLGRLQSLQEVLADVQHQVQQEIRAVKMTLGHQD
jgi:DNA-binding SARP family transcriptional activator